MRSLHSSSPDLNIRAVSNGYVVEARDTANGGLTRSDSSTYVFSGPNAETALGLFVANHFKAGRHVAEKRAAVENDVAIPGGLPSNLPPLPAGFSRWAYRGMGWRTAEAPDAWAATYEDSSDWMLTNNLDKSELEKRAPAGDPEAFYLEAVK